MYSCTLSRVSKVFLPSRTNSIESQLGIVKQNERSSSVVPEGSLIPCLSLFFVSGSHTISSISLLRLATVYSSQSSLNCVGLNSLRSNKFSFFPRSKSHIRCEIGKSISLLSTMLFAVKVPAKLNRSVVSFTSWGDSALTSTGLGKRDPSRAPVRHIYPSLKSFMLLASSVKYSQVGPRPVPCSPLKLISRDLRFSSLSIMRSES